MRWRCRAIRHRCLPQVDEVLVELSWDKTCARMQALLDEAVAANQARHLRSFRQAVRRGAAIAPRITTSHRRAPAFPAPCWRNGWPPPARRCSFATSVRTSPAMPSTPQRRRHPDPQIRTAHLPHQQRGDLRLSLPLHALAALRAPRAGERRRQAAADPDQPHHAERALRPRPDERGRGRGIPRRRAPSRWSEIRTSRGRGGLAGRPRALRDLLPRAIPASNGGSIPRSSTSR